MRFDPHCRVPEIVKTVPHLAFAVDDLDAALEGKQILIAPNSPSRGVRVAFILDDGARSRRPYFLCLAAPAICSSARAPANIPTMP
jgi:hypothetical protein